MSITSIKVREMQGWLLLAVIGCSLLYVSGCSRSKARLRADCDANCLIDQKSPLAGAAPGQYRIGIDRDSRMYDPHSPDCPPMPPDDPTSHRYMHCVDGKRGDKFWREAPRTPYVDPPAWRQLLPLNNEGKLVLDTEAAVLLGIKNDPDYQRELEELYLSALDVSFERFRFDTQLFGGADLDFIADGRVRSGTGESSSLLAVSPSSPANRWRLQKLSATGGELVVGLANSLVWQFAGPNDYAGNTLLDFSLVQPLLRGGGRLQVLERLTVAERTLLANVRSMERFRREYYLNVVVGRGIGAGAQRRGNLLSVATNLFSGVDTGAGAVGSGAYLGILQQQQVLRNQRSNVLALQESTEQLVDSYNAGRIDRFQVELARQALFNAQSSLLNAEANYETLLDSFKVNLGLPPDLELAIEDPVLDQFSLLAPQLTNLQNRTADLLQVTREANNPVEELELNEQKTAPDAADVQKVIPIAVINAGKPSGPSMALPGLIIKPKSTLKVAEKKPEPIADELLAAKPELSSELSSAITSESLPNNLQAATEAASEAAELLSLAQDQIGVVEKDLQRLIEVAPARREHLLALGSRPEVNQTRIDTAIFDPLRFDQRIEDVEADLMTLKGQFKLLDNELKTNSKETQRTLSKLSAMLLDLSILQARIRLDSIDLDPIKLDSTEAIQIASFYRRDWANARAGLVDAWRLIHFAANNLESALDIVFSGDIGNVGDNPFRLRDTNGRLRVGIEFDSPTSRLAERNVYRESIIQYQQARRSYYQFVDQINQGLRATLRQTRLNEINLELRREAVFVAVAQVDLVRLRLTEPPKPGETASFNNTTARDLVQALGDLLSAQNDLLSVWVNNRVQRLQLELQLGVMLVDSEGLRVDIDQPLDLFLSESTRTQFDKIRLLPPVRKGVNGNRRELAYAQDLSEPAHCEAVPIEAGPIEAVPIETVQNENYRGLIDVLEEEIASKSGNQVVSYQTESNKSLRKQTHSESSKGSN